MNYEYFFNKNKVVVFDELLNIKERKYNDNIEKILIEENAVELLENEQKRLENARNLKKDKKFKDHVESFKKWGIALAFFSIFPFLMLIIVGLVCDMPFLSAIVASIHAIGAIIIGVIPFKNAFDDLHNYKKNKKEIDAIDSQLDYIYSEVKKRKENLNELKEKSVNSNNNTKIIQLFPKKVNDAEQKQEIYNNLLLYYRLGYKLKKYLKLLKKGKLNQVIENDFNKYNNDQEKNNLSLVEDYIKEKSMILSKKNNY